jgi:lipopolysaccharide/colanic/teichoic acid biosynthesis glycosyltransferase
MPEDIPLHEKVDPWIRNRFKNIFALKQPLNNRISKEIFDKLLAFLSIPVVFPLIFLIIIAMLIEGLFFSDCKGPIFASYWSYSKGEKFIKYKFRIAKYSLRDKKALKGDFSHQYHMPQARENITYVGWFLKKYYLDELVQIFNIIKGDISFIGPRALAVFYYLKEIEEGNITRKLIKSGIFSENHIRKGSIQANNKFLEYYYIEKYITLSGINLVLYDMSIILRGIKMILEGKG